MARRGWLARSTMLGMAGQQPYSPQVLTTQPANLIGYWPLWEASGTVAADVSGNGRNGSYTSVVLAQPGIGDGRTLAGFGGNASYANLFNTSLRDAWNGQEFSLIIWMRPINAGIWSDGGIRMAFKFAGDASNYIQIFKTASVNYLTWDTKLGGTAATYTQYPAQYTEWTFDARLLTLGITGSKSNNRIRAYIDGTRIGGKLAMDGTWSGALASAIASYNTAWAWNGSGGHVAAYSIELTPAEMATLAWTNRTYSAVFYGDSVTAGTGASDAAHAWRTLVAGARNWRVPINRGTNNTVLQNSVQNSVAVLGAAVSDNGRDQYAAKVLPYESDYVLILYGLNDIRLNDAGFSAANFQTDLGEIVDGIVSNGTPASQIVIGSPPYCKAYGSSSPWDGGSAAKHAQYVAACAAVAASKGTRYVDVYQWMIDHGGDTLISADNLHPNDAGHAAIAHAFLSVL